jgi:hypothetical protein
MGLLNRFQTKGTTLTSLKGAKPKNTLVKDVIQVNDTFSKGLYQDYIVDIKVDVRRAQDTTGNQ